MSKTKKGPTGKGGSELPASIKRLGKKKVKEWEKERPSKTWKHKTVGKEKRHRGEERQKRATEGEKGFTNRTRKYQSLKSDSAQ